MNVDDVASGFIAKGIPQELVDELIKAYVEAKRRYHLNDLRPQAVEGGRFSEAVFRILQWATDNGTYTPLSKSMPKVDSLLQTLANVPARSVLDDSLRVHIPRTLRLIYDIRNKRDAAHLQDGIDPNLQDATLIVTNIDWVMAELVRLYHGVSADEAQAIIDDVVTREVPAVQEIAGQPVILKELQPRDQVLLMLYRAGMDHGATLDEMVEWLRVKTQQKGNLKNRLLKLDEQRLVLAHPKTGRFHITIPGMKDVEQRKLMDPE